MRRAGQERSLTAPYGGRLIDLVEGEDERRASIERGSKLPRLRLNARAVCDLELLATGGFSPLTRFMGEADYESVVEGMRLSDGTLFPIPVTLPVEDSDEVEIGEEVALADAHNDLLAVMRIEEIFTPERAREAQGVCGSIDPRHPLVSEMNSWGARRISGALRVCALPRYYDFRDLRLTPHETREQLALRRAPNVVAFQTRNPLHRAHEELVTRAAEAVGGTLLLHPVVGMTKPGDIDHYTRVRSYKVLADKYFDPRRTLLALLPLAMSTLR